jgi:hypothetical protein
VISRWNEGGCQSGIASSHSRGGTTQEPDGEGGATNQGVCWLNHKVQGLLVGPWDVLTRVEMEDTIDYILMIQRLLRPSAAMQVVRVIAGFDRARSVEL